MKPFYIKPNDLNELENLANLLGSLGFRIISKKSYQTDPAGFIQFFTETGLKSYKYVKVDFNGRTLDMSTVPQFDRAVYHYDSDLPTILNVLLNGNGRKMQLTSEYEAVVEDTYIQVGCQKITFEKFDELAKIVAKVRG